jgi:hypothetical protein
MLSFYKFSYFIHTKPRLNVLTSENLPRNVIVQPLKLT